MQEGDDDHAGDDDEGGHGASGGDVGLVRPQSAEVAAAHARPLDVPVVLQLGVTVPRPEHGQEHCFFKKNKVGKKRL